MKESRKQIAAMVRAEIKAQKNVAEGSYVPGDDNNYWYGKVVLCDELLAFLDTLPEQLVSDHHEIEVKFRGEKVTISREFYRDGEMNYSTSEQDDNAIWSALRAWCEKKGITPFELYPKQSEQPVEGLDVTDFCKPIDPDIAQCVADHFWEMIGEESTNKKPVEWLEEEYLRFVRSDHHQYQDLIGKGGIDLARHFAEWGAKHLKSNLL